MTLTRRLDRLANHWPHPAAVLASRLGAELAAATPHTLQDAAARYHRCRALIAAARVSEAATGRALAQAMIAGGFPAEGVRQCLADMPGFFVLAIACLGVSQVAAWLRVPDVEGRRFDEYLDSVLTELEREQLDDLAQRLTVTESE